MFLKKSLLFTTALALLMFAGQTSAQPTVSLTHVPGEGGTARDGCSDRERPLWLRFPKRVLTLFRACRCRYSGCMSLAY